MKDVVQNVLHNRKYFDDIILLEVVVSQCSNNTHKCEQWFMKHLFQNVVPDSIHLNIRIFY